MVDFEWQIRRSARRKTLSLCVYPDNRVIVSAPQKLSQRDIIGFVEKKSDWVRKKLDLNHEMQEKLPPREFNPGEKLLYLGEVYSLEVRERRHAGVSCKKDKILVSIRPWTPERLRALFVRRELIIWYAEMAQIKLIERVTHFMGRVGAKPTAVRVKDLRSRWGSCSTRGVLNFSWYIIMAPPPVLDYLVVHELCHLVHRNHSAEYWKLVETHLPGHREKRKWLRENGRFLTL
jgi:hypothetical protein